MAANTANRESVLEEELHLYALIRDDADAVAIHIQESVRHLADARAEVVRILESASKITEGISPHALPAVREGAELLLVELDDVESAHLVKDSVELRELAALVNKQARRLNGGDDA